MKYICTYTVGVIIITLLCIILIRIHDLRNCIIPMMEYMNARAELENRIFKILLEEARSEIDIHDL